MPKVFFFSVEYSNSACMVVGIGKVSLSSFGNFSEEFCVGDVIPRLILWKFSLILLLRATSEA
jgi:hypothetical protein